MKNSDFLNITLLAILLGSCDRAGQIPESQNVASNTASNVATPTVAPVPAPPARARLVNVEIPFSGGLMAYYETPSGGVMFCRWGTKFEPAGCAQLPPQPGMTTG